jgi:hypothetical protein
MNYKIIGGDEKEYGPVSVEQLREWLNQGRVSPQTLIQQEGETGWRPLSTFPELMPLAATTPSVIGPTTAVPAQADARAMMNGPAIGVLVSGILGGVGAIAGIAMNTLGMTFGAMGRPRGGGNQTEQFINMFAGGFGVVQSIAHIAVASVIIYGALKMMKLQNFRLAMATSILALAPCVSPCCLLGMPFGIWALVVLNKPEVKSAFE